MDASDTEEGDPVQLPALELADALLETRLYVREATGDLELLLESHAAADSTAPEPRAATRTANRAIHHLHEAQERLDSLYGTILEARRRQTPGDGGAPQARPVDLTEVQRGPEVP
jgi:hypothetical protein